jgi:hypothetical protein
MLTRISPKGDENVGLTGSEAAGLLGVGTQK